AVVPVFRSLGNSGLHMPAVAVVGGRLDTVLSITGFRWTCEYLLDRFCVQSSEASRHFQRCRELNEIRGSCDPAAVRVHGLKLEAPVAPLDVRSSEHVLRICSLIPGRIVVDFLRGAPREE